MSYCHLTPAGINFDHGFGPEPRQRILDHIANASCLEVCDDGPECKIYYEDADGDSFGNPDSSKEICGEPSNGWVLDNTDCNDNDANQYPEAPCEDS